MATFTLWSEGFSCTGQQATALFHGIYEADTFIEACDIWSQEDDENKKYYDRSGPAYWGCRLFDNEVDARKSFG